MESKKVGSVYCDGNGDLNIHKPEIKRDITIFKEGKDVTEKYLVSFKTGWLRHIKHYYPFGASDYEDIEVTLKIPINKQLSNSDAIEACWFEIHHNGGIYDKVTNIERLNNETITVTYEFTE